MNILLILGVLVVAVLLCEKYEQKLPFPISTLFSLWKTFAAGLGAVMNFLILTILWIVGFGTYAIILKIIRLPKLFASDPKTYWIPSEAVTSESLQRQF